MSDKLNDDLQYANELYNAVNIYYSEQIEIKQLVIKNINDLSDSLINIINTYDYMFIHCINNLDKNTYIRLYKNINCKKILFIIEQNIKIFNLTYDLTLLRPLLLNCYKICIYKYSKDIKTTICNLLNNDNELLNTLLVDIDYIYNFDKVNVEDIIKDKEISLLSNKGLHTKYDIFINMFMNRGIYLNDFYWNIYGVEKNIQTMSIDNLFINKQSNTKSIITNFDTNNLCYNKINVFGDLNSNIIKHVIEHSAFICYFDSVNNIKYSLLNIIANGAVPIFYINYAKNIHINDKQTLYDLNCGIYIGDNFIHDTNTIILLNKYLMSNNTYKNLLLKNIKTFKQLFNVEKTLINLLNNIQ